MNNNNNDSNQQRHFKKSNNKANLSSILLSIILLTGVSLVPAIHRGVYGQQLQLQPQQRAAQQQNTIGISQIIQQIAQQVANANPGTNATQVYQILVHLARQTAQIISKEQAIGEIQQIYSQVSTYPYGTVSQSLANFAQQVASGNGNVVQIVGQTIQDKASSSGGSKDITHSITDVAVQQATGGSKSVNLAIRHAAQILANRAGVPVEKVEPIIIQIALQIASSQGKTISGQSLFRLANLIIQNPNGILAQAILKLVQLDDGGRSIRTATIIKNVVEVSSSQGGGRRSADGKKEISDYPRNLGKNGGYKGCFDFFSCFNTYLLDYMIPPSQRGMTLKADARTYNGGYDGLEKGGDSGDSSTKSRSASTKSRSADYGEFRLPNIHLRLPDLFGN